MLKLDAMAIIRRLKERYDIVGEASVDAYLRGEIRSADNTLGALIKNKNPYDVFSDDWKKCRGIIQQGNHSVAQLQEMLMTYRRFATAAQVPSDEQFWQEEIAKLENLEGKRFVKTASALAGLLIGKWGEQLKTADAGWQQQQHGLIESKLLRKMREWLDLYNHRRTLQKELGALRLEYPHVTGDQEVQELLAEKIRSAGEQAEFSLLKEKNHIEAHVENYTQAQQDLRRGNYAAAATEADLESYREFTRSTGARDAGAAVDEKFWQEEIAEQKQREAQSKKSDDDGGNANAAKVLRMHLQHKWGEALNLAQMRWRLEKLAEYRCQLFERLREWLKLLEQMRTALEPLSLSPGLFYDLSKDGLYQSDIDALKKWAKYLQNDPGVKELCEILGRLRTASHIKRQELIKTTEIVRTNRVDVNSREEIVGVTVGDNIEYAIPAEKGLLAHADTELLFYLKVAEKRLLQFEMQGIAGVEEEVEKEEMREVSEEESKGPMIICVDTSGSMQGAPETLAKAVSLYLTAQAKREKRNCYLINFSTGIKTCDLSGEYSLQNLLKFLGMSFHGGTDVAPAIKHALETMQKEAYARADLLVVSDFVMGALPEGMVDSIRAARARKNKFYSLAIGNLSLSPVRDVFDNEWVYNPHSGGIEQLLDFADKVGE